MIAVVSGLLGSGKSWWVTRRGVDHVRDGGVLVSNLTFNLPAFRDAVFPRRISSRQLIHVDATDSPFDLPRGDFRGHGSRRVMIVLDEALNWFASSEAKTDDRKRTWGEWLRQSDKLGQDVYFVAQDFSRAAKWIRELAQVSIHVINFGQVSVFHIPIGRIFRLRRFCGVSWFDMGTKTVSQIRFYRINARIWKCYDTAQLWGFQAAGNAYDGLALPPAFPVPRRSYLTLLALIVLGVVRNAV